jgi:hypothetical protein
MYARTRGCIIAATERVGTTYLPPSLMGRLDLTSAGRRPISPLLDAGPFLLGLQRLSPLRNVMKLEKSLI